MLSNLKILNLLVGILLVSTAWAGEETSGEKEFKPWQFKFGGEERLRYEYKQDFDFNESKEDNGSQLYHRLRLNVAASLIDENKNSKLDFFVEGLDAQTGGYQIKASAGQTDDFDLHQIYLNARNILGSDFDIKAGRQELKYGKGRLIAGPTWSNRIRSFDGGVLRYQKNGLYADIFYGQDVKYDDDKFNQSRSEEFLTGLYGGYQKDKTTPLFEPYFLSLIDIKGTNDITRYTTGARLMANIFYGIAVDIEVPYQFGHTGTTTAGTKDIAAYAVHIDVSKNFENTKGKPKLTLAYDEASGDKDPNDSVNQTFIPLYQSTHDTYGLLDFFRWQNIRNLEMNLALAPTPKLKIIPQIDFFWLQSKFDNWYNSSGGTVRAKTSGERGYYVGSEIALRGSYDLNKYLKWESGYAHFFTGGYVADSGADDDADWLYSQMVVKF